MFSARRSKGVQNLDDKKVWERGVKLPEQPPRSDFKRNATNRRSSDNEVRTEQEVKPVANKKEASLSPLAPAPKVNPWGNIPEPAASQTGTTTTAAESSVQSKIDTPNVSKAVKRVPVAAPPTKPTTTAPVVHPKKTAWGKPNPVSSSSSLSAKSTPFEPSSTSTTSFRSIQKEEEEKRQNIAEKTKLEPTTTKTAWKTSTVSQCNSKKSEPAAPAAPVTTATLAKTAEGSDATAQSTPDSSHTAVRSSVAPWAALTQHRPAAPKIEKPIPTTKAADKKASATSSKKRKPKLAAMSIGDLMPSNHVLKKKAAKQSPSTTTKTSSMLGSADFPSLVATPAPQVTPTAILPKGAKLPQKQAAEVSKTVKKSPDAKAKAKQKKKQKKRLDEMTKPKAKEVVAKMDAHHSAAALGANLFPNVEGGGQFDLLRLYQGEKGGNINIQKGRQRVRPQKKKFSSLKKKVLEERLEKWKDQHPDNKEEKKEAVEDSLGGAVFTTVCLYGFCEEEELEDDDEYDEITDNLLEMASKIRSTAVRVFVPRSLGDNNVGEWPVFVDFEITPEGEENKPIAGAAVECWNGLVLAGRELRCRPVFPETDTVVHLEQAEWQDWCIAAAHSFASEKPDAQMVGAEDDASSPVVVVLTNALTEDDLEDEDCMEESLTDIKALAEKYGRVQGIEADTEQTEPTVLISYDTSVVEAQRAATEISKVVIGGSQVTARVGSDKEILHETQRDFSVSLRNVLTEDDLEDEDCLEESLYDIRELAQRFGAIRGVTLEPGCDDNGVGSEGHAVTIRFATLEEAKSGAQGFDGMIIGGLTVSASISEGDGECSNCDSGVGRDQSTSKDPKPMYSGSKLIPERFAECKRAPKVANQQGPRKYATLSTDENAKPLLVEMLGELMRLQKRAMDDKNAKARRRIVMGLREVPRGIRSHKVKMVMMANNLDEYGIIDKKLQEIIDLCHAEDVPIFYDFSKRTLGKALGKSIKVAVAGVQNADGAHQQFKKLVKIASIIQ